MGTERTVSRLVLAGVLAGLLSACGSSDAKDYSNVKLKINELQTSNMSTIQDSFLEYDDWFELYNAGSEDVELEGFIVGDSKFKVTLPAGVTVPATGVVLLWADDTPTQGPDHLAFKLSKSGDAASISDPNGRELDSVLVEPAAPLNSYARFPDGTGEFVWCLYPSPGELNGETCTPPVAP